MRHMKQRAKYLMRNLKERLKILWLILYKVSASNEKTKDHKTYIDEEGEESLYLK